MSRWIPFGLAHPLPPSGTLRQNRDVPVGFFCCRSRSEPKSTRPRRFSVGAVNRTRRRGINAYEDGGVLCSRPERIGTLRTPIRARGSRATCNGSHVLLALPTSHRTKHLWSFLGRGFGGRLKATQAAVARRGGDRLPPTPVSSETRDLVLAGLCL
ncbi:hypothetical protein MPNT_60023 [Candidatus Methylacidithermus pantelleriae]|uniref:Uncharacterized protein n=1 Tax=Candidatus Methylacidithermus pantelleriae TaxID=2744239 RepID=A0A8J2BV90_9BACT|nr:hypothetical protein MPNT_60023 [Candidatus Methylacidithermus pantelleriae]